MTDAGPPAVVDAMTEMPWGHVTAIDADGSSTCALDSSGQVMCWGDAGEWENRTKPTVVQGVTGSSQLAVAEMHRCTSDVGHVRCWGKNHLSQLGVSSGSGIVMPIAEGARLVRSRGSTSCALMNDGTVECWGYALSRVAGEDRSEWTYPRGDTPEVQHRPAKVPGVSGASDLVLGPWAACAVVGKDNVCWGSNHGSQLGDIGDHQLQPAPMQALAGLSKLALGGNGACGVDAKGRTMCTGIAVRAMGGIARNADGIPVANSAADVETFMREHERIAGEKGVARHVKELDGAVGFALGDFHSCAVLKTGRVRCWGNGDDGQLGDGTTKDSDTPVEVVGISDAEAVAVGSGHSCALRRGGRVSCWGRNSFGQLGDGTETKRAKPVEVAGLPPPAN